MKQTRLHIYQSVAIPNSAVFNLTSEDTWQPLGSCKTYRWISRGANYRADEPWPGSSGRFDDAQTPSLYLSFTPEGAVAEFLRWNYKLIPNRHKLILEIYEVFVTSKQNGLDVSTRGLADAVHIRWDRLRSSDHDEQVRYRECRQLSEEVIKASGVSIKYPSAALEETHNVVLFQTRTSTWTAKQGDQVSVPPIDPERVTPLL